MNNTFNFIKSLKESDNYADKVENLEDQLIADIITLNYNTLKSDITIGLLTDGRSFIRIEDEIWVYPDSKAFDILKDLDNGVEGADARYEDAKDYLDTQGKLAEEGTPIRDTLYLSTLPMKDRQDYIYDLITRDGYLPF